MPIDNQSGGAIAIGGQIRYVFPGRAPIALLAEGYYAPDVTSMSDFKGVTEARIGLELEVTPSARAYVGWRSLEFELGPGLAGNPDNKFELDDEAHIGVRFSF